LLLPHLCWTGLYQQLLWADDAPSGDVLNTAAATFTAAAAAAAAGTYLFHGPDGSQLQLTLVQW
jgi:hypothetical protein